MRSKRKGYGPAKRLQRQLERKRHFQNAEKERREQEDKLADYKPPKDYGPDWRQADDEKDNPD